MLANGVSATDEATSEGRTAEYSVEKVAGGASVIAGGAPVTVTVAVPHSHGSSPLSLPEGESPEGESGLPDF